MPHLVFLEPHLSSSSYLSILKPAAAQAQKGTLATPVREKKVNVKEALEHVLGREAVGIVEPEGLFSSSDAARQPLTRTIAPDPDAGPDDPCFYTLTFASDAERSYRMMKRHCERSTWARAIPAAEEGEEDVEDPGGWRWEWA